MHCLWCDEEQVPEVVWTTVLAPRKEKVVCEACASQFSVLQGSQCPRCARPMEKAEICSDCIRWQEQSAALKRNVSVYEYNNWMKDVIAKWKYRGDYVLVGLFKDQIVSSFTHAFPSKEAFLVPIPLSEERLAERGFNQALAIAECLDLPIEQALSRINSEKQSKKTRADRMRSTNPFQVILPIKQPVILVDDIYTTGRTLQFAAEALVREGCPRVEAFTLVRG
ncbi:ComF family protein [Pontibacillus yanchengensis]|uniref:Phosphoribosyltransferase n=1 Tax=Pontibacillus yanchengensis Y32 TaxID=1385514 RepID=A0A0A2TW83_9BACI|nr:ComF family protein [Pontibacillus yanchengensis]KGP73555.1 phosphoribosyltransferase [Pontibacillus yanchengensis Y32]